MASPTALPDADTRHTVASALDQTMFVEAGAGSGKTTSLVNRIVNLVASGVPVGRIAAITFTEAAARELRTRVRDELEGRADRDNDRHLRNAAGQVESAAFTTLHGFALRLLADHPVEAGLPPGFGVADEIGSMLDFDESWRLFTGQMGDDLSLLDLQERAAVLGVELARFVDIARRFDDNWDLLDHVDRDPAPLSALDVTGLVSEMAGLGTLTEHCSDDADLFAAELSASGEKVAGCPVGDPLGQLEWVMGFSWPKMNKGKKANWVGVELDQVKDQVKAVRARVDAHVDGLRVEVINHFVARVAAFVEHRVTDRRERGELAFHDLLVLARQLLRRSPGVREQLHQRYTRLLLDEFQDTDPIQIELAVLLATDEDTLDHPWQELATRLAPGRLAVVGDPKQSIYRFRRADIGVYSDAEAALVPEASRLTANFRSVPGIVEWINDFFGRVIGDGHDGAQPRYTPLVATREPVPEADQGSDPATGLDVPVLAIGGPHDKSIGVGEIRELEATDVAAVVCRAIEEEWLTERDGQWLPIRLRDIAVLIPSRLSLSALESAFATADIPFRPETSSLVYATQEVRDVLAGVRAVVDPTSSVHVVAALRSALFAVGDDDLLSWHLAGGTWNYLDPDRPDEAATHPVAEAFAVLARWHHDRWWLDPSALIDRIVRERRLRELALAESRPRDRWRRYRFLTEQAREFTALRGGDLQDFVDWVEVQSSDLARVTEPIPAEPDDDAVRVLTVHGSKGLEFPMVILAGAPTREQNRAPGPQVLFPAGAAPEVKLAKGKATQQFDVHASVEEVLDAHERVRLHYVAATRARDVLVVSGHHKEGLQSSGRRTWEGLQECPHLWRPFEARGDERYRIEPPTQLRLAGGTYEETRQVWCDEQDRLLGVAATPSVFSATGLAELLTGEPESVPATAQHDGDDGPRRGRAGSAIGSAVHAVLEVIDFVDPVDIPALAGLYCEREGIPDEADDVGRRVEAALLSPTIDLARRHRHWRELYVAAPLAGVLLEGFVDLCVDTPDGLLIVDYKTDAVASDEEIDAKLHRYRIQGAVYAHALAHITGRADIGCRFVFIGADRTIERDLTQLPETMAEVLDHVSGLEMVTHG